MLSHDEDAGRAPLSFVLFWLVGGVGRTCCCLLRLTSCSLSLSLLLSLTVTLVSIPVSFWSCPFFSLFVPPPAPPPLLFRSVISLSLSLSLFFPHRAALRCGRICEVSIRVSDFSIHGGPGWAMEQGYEEWGRRGRLGWDDGERLNLVQKL